MRDPIPRNCRSRRLSRAGAPGSGPADPYDGLEKGESELGAAAPSFPNMLLPLFALLQITATGRIDRPALFLDAKESVWPFGSSVSAIGDVDGDGDPDIAVGTPCPQLGAVGRVQVYSGANGCELVQIEGERRDGLFGFQLADADLDADGRRELLVAEPRGTGETGRVRAFLLESGDELPAYESDAGGEDFGWSLDVGDVTGDGCQEVVVGAPSARMGAGCVYVFSRRGRVLARIVGKSPGDRLGWSVDARADFDGDGANDLVIGAPRAGGTGAVHVHSVAAGRDLVRLSGRDRGEVFGFSVSSLRDASGDGASDVVVGAPWRNGEHVKSGAVQVFRSDDWSAAYSIEWSGGFTLEFEEGYPRTSHMSMRFGHSVLELPDVDGDGRSDFAVAATAGFSYFGCPSGWVATVSGATGDGLRLFSGSSPPWNYGASLDFLESTDDPWGATLLIGGPGDGLFHSHPMVDRRHLGNGDDLGRLEVCLDSDCSH